MFEHSSTPFEMWRKSNAEQDRVDLQLKEAFLLETMTWMGFAEMKKKDGDDSVRLLF